MGDESVHEHGSHANYDNSTQGILILSCFLLFVYHVASRDTKVDEWNSHVTICKLADDELVYTQIDEEMSKNKTTTQAFSPLSLLTLFWEW